VARYWRDDDLPDVDLVREVPEAKKPRQIKITPSNESR
jgi:hypothetical protein